MSVLKTKASFLTESIKDSSQIWTSGHTNEKVVKAIHQEGTEGAGVKRMRLGVAWSLSSLSLLEVAPLSRGGSLLVVGMGSFLSFSMSGSVRSGGSWPREEAKRCVGKIEGRPEEFIKLKVLEVSACIPSLKIILQRITAKRLASIHQMPATRHTVQSTHGKVFKCISHQGNAHINYIHQHSIYSEG